MPVIQITDTADARVAPFTALTDHSLRNAPSPVFIAESPKVIRVALASGHRPTAIMCEDRHITGDAADIIAACPDVPVYTAPRTVLAAITGYTLTRGVLAAFPRPAAADPATLLANARRAVVIDDVSDTTNIGSIFRSAAALGADAVLLTPTSCDPLHRRSIRVSMGSVFLIPWARIPAGPNAYLHSQGFRTAALALTDRSVAITDHALNAEPRLALILGTEGEGLPQATIDGADYTAKIPMYHTVDSLNVAAAAAVAIYQLVQNPEKQQPLTNYTVKS